MKQGCDVLNNEKGATHMASVMPYRVCVMWSIVRVMTLISGCDVTHIVYMWPYVLDVVSYIEAVMS